MWWVADQFFEKESLMFKRKRKRILEQYRTFCVMFPEKEARNIIKAIIRQERKNVPRTTSPPS